jgi:hypothetical protein
MEKETSIANTRIFVIKTYAEMKNMTGTEIWWEYESWNTLKASKTKFLKNNGYEKTFDGWKPGCLSVFTT